MVELLPLVETQGAVEEELGVPMVMVLLVRKEVQVQSSTLAVAAVVVAVEEHQEHKPQVAAPRAAMGVIIHLVLEVVQEERLQRMVPQVPWAVAVEGVEQVVL